MDKRIKQGWLIALLGALIATAAAQQTTVYRVKEGDSLYKIAHRFGLRLPDLLKVNRLRNPHRLKPGDVIRIPLKDKKGVQHRPSRSHKGLTRRFPSRTAALLQQIGELDQSDIPNRAMAQRVLRVASRYLGRAYRYGGSSARGFDCSGFALYVYRSVGIHLPHSARAQAKRGKPVARHQLQPGDLVFFRTRGRHISHVGIYIGDGKFIHASSARGRVRIDSLEKGYYKQRYAGARRLCP
jgi:peptidoglycan endopeptidase LytE